MTRGVMITAVTGLVKRAGGVVARLSLRQTALVVMLVLLSHTAAVGGTAYLCRMDGQMHSSCCCESQPHDRQTACVRPQGSFCCDVRVSTSSQPPAKLQEASPSTKNASAADLPVLLVADLFSSKRPTNLAFETPPPPARNRSIQVLVCSFLI